MILTTSNVTEKIDLAFVDRADIKQYIGPPSEEGIYNIYLSCLEELMKVTEQCSNIYNSKHLYFHIQTLGLILRVIRFYKFAGDCCCEIISERRNNCALTRHHLTGLIN